MIEDFLKVEVEMIRPRYGGVNGYVCTHDYLLKHGHFFKSAALDNLERAFALRQQRECPSKECYANAQRLLLCYYGDSQLQLGYVEGVATSGIIPVDHAWNTINGKLVDLTWGPMKKVTRRNGEWYLRRTSRVLGAIPEGFEYYGVEISYEDVVANMLAHKLFTSVIDDYTCEWPVLRGVKGHNKETP